jgi:aspartyl/asparaginyl-tRNA synthetase
MNLPGRERLSIAALTRSHVGQTVVFRARLTSSRIKGKVAFLDVRQRTHSVQVYIPVAKGGASQQMINWISEIPAESIVLIEGVVGSSDWEIKGATVKDMEIKGEKVSRSVHCSFHLADHHLGIPHYFSRWNSTIRSRGCFPG